MVLIGEGDGVEEAGNGKPFPAIAGKVHAVVLGKQIAQCFTLDLKWGRGRGAEWEGEYALFSLPFGLERDRWFCLVHRERKS